MTQSCSAVATGKRERRYKAGFRWHYRSDLLRFGFDIAVKPNKPSLRG